MLRGDEKAERTGLGGLVASGFHDIGYDVDVKSLYCLASEILFETAAGPFFCSPRGSRMETGPVKKRIGYGRPCVPLDAYSCKRFLLFFRLLFSDLCLLSNSGKPRLHLLRTLSKLTAFPLHKIPPASLPRRIQSCKILVGYFPNQASPAVYLRSFPPQTL